MKHILYLVFLFCAAQFAISQPATVDIVYKKPYLYEKRNGSLRVVATIPLKKGKNTMVMLDNQSMEIKHSSEDSLDIWLPLVGDKKHLQIYTNKKKDPVVDQLFSPLIPEDWGYFQNGTIHTISSSHQDIAWMNTPDSCRHDRIYNIINPAMEMMKDDPDFSFGMEQTLNLMEFLDEFPNRKDEVGRYYKEGRFAWGATFNQPYEGLESGEQLVRQAYYGRKWIKENLPGCDDVTAYNIDVPGRTLQMPQIYAKSGIKNLFISRMREGLYNWYSPDGSKVFTYTPGNYGWGVLVWKYLEEDAVTGLNLIHHRAKLWSDYFQSRKFPPHYAIVISNDSEKPANYKTLVDEWNRIANLSEIPLPRIKHSTAESYFAEVNVGNAEPEKVTGERPDLWLYIHGPAHYQAILAKRKAGVLLPAAEIFTTFNCLEEGSLSTYPKSDFDKAWMASIYPDHGWGGKHGEITDSIFRASLEYARNQGKQLLDKALGSLTKKIKTKDNAIVIFNDLSWTRTNLVSVDIEEASIGNTIIKDLNGTQVPAQIVKKETGYAIAFIAESIPPLGYKTYYMGKGKPSDALPKSVKQYSNYCENTYYKVTFGDGGIQSLYDKELNREVLNTTKFAGGDILDVGYTGNGAGEFTQITSPTPGDLTAISSQKALWEIVESGPVFTTFENRQQMEHTVVVQRVRMLHGLKNIDFNVTLTDFDGTHNRQFRIALPIRMEKATIDYEVPMGMVQVGKDEMKSIPGGWAWGGTYRQRPEEINPREIQNFISAHGDGFGITLSSCVAVADWVDPSREAVDYPILQGILLSSHKSCHGLGNWYEQKGRHQYEFSIRSHASGWQNGYRFGVEANHPLHVVSKTKATDGKLSAEASFMTISERFVNVSTIKRCDNSNEIIVRLTDVSGKDSQVKVNLLHPIQQVISTNLIEEEQSVLPTPTPQGALILPVGHYAIETFKLKPSDYIAND